MTQQERLKLQLNADGIRVNSSEEPPTQLVEREQLEGTPFWIIGNNEEGYFLAFGKFKMTERYKTKDEVIEYLNSNEYNIIAQMILCTLEHQHLLKTN